MQVAALYGVSVHELREVNPDVRNMKGALPAGFLIALPDSVDDIALLTEKPLKKAHKRRLSLAQSN
jgi:hypothetical protein